jgi:membrane-associated protein
MAHQCAGQAHLGLAGSGQVAGRRRTEERAVASIVSGLTAALGHMSGWVAITLIAVLVFGETAIFLGFVLPGEAAVVFGGVLASRGHLSLPLLIGVVVVTAVTGPMVGYEVGKRMGDRLFTTRTLRRVSGPLDRARTTLRNRGGIAVLGGRFLAIVRALMPAAAGAAEMPYRVFAIHNLLGGVVWGVGYSLLGYLAGSAYVAVERTVGTGLAIAVAAAVVAAAAVWAWRRHRRIAVSPLEIDPLEIDPGPQADPG